jgi:two-component system, NtrC family, response regulator HupR/HoxA
MNAPDPLSTPPAHLPTVLLVDDEVRSLDAMRRTLDEDFDILTAESAEQARALLARQEVAVILCDQRMPGQTGVEFLKEVRERWPDTVRIVISGYTDSEDIIAGINQAGIYQYILKPWVPDHLLQTVRHCCACAANNAWARPARPSTSIASYAPRAARWRRSAPPPPSWRATTCRC